MDDEKSQSYDNCCYLEKLIISKPNIFSIINKLKYLLKYF